MTFGEFPDLDLTIKKTNVLIEKWKSGYLEVWKKNMAGVPVGRSGTPTSHAIHL